MAPDSRCTACLRVSFFEKMERCRPPLPASFTCRSEGEDEHGFDVHHKKYGIREAGEIDPAHSVKTHTETQRLASRTADGLLGGDDEAVGYLRVTHGIRE